jgi:bifunctional oligoribonuclease and PAP phosphatase NrnA
MIITSQTSKEILTDAHSVLLIITGAMTPDGDSIGANLGLLDVLTKLGKKVDIRSTLPIPKKLAFIPGKDHIDIIDPAAFDYRSFDLVVVPDTSDESLAADKTIHPSFTFPEDVITLSIDHHASSKDWAHYSLINKEASSSSEIIAELFKSELNGNAYASTKLLTGIITDTGGFKYNLHPNTFQTAGALVGNGADITGITDALNRYQPDTLIGLELIKKGIEHLAWDKTHRFTYTFISIKDILHLGGTSQHMREYSGQVINRFARSLAGSQFGATFIEVDEGIIDVELRGNRNSTFDLSAIAIKFGGGGHRDAGGYTIEGELGDVMNTFMNEIG